MGTAPRAPVRRFAAALAVLGPLAAAAAVSPAGAAGEDVRRLGAELAVMAGDLRRLRTEDLAPAHRKGLRDRLAGGLAPLSLLIRAAREADPALPPTPADSLATLRRALAANDLAALAAGIAELTALYPLDLTGVLPPDARPAALARARKIHEDHCAGCHEAGDVEAERPALDFFAMAAAMDARELAARMIVGVRGDAVTGLGNPLTDMEISALIALFRGGRQFLPK